MPRKYVTKTKAGRPIYSTRNSSSSREGKLRPSALPRRFKEGGKICKKKV